MQILSPKCQIQPCRVSAYIHRREWDLRIRTFHFGSFLTFGHRLICVYVLGLCVFINDHFHYHLQPARRFVSHFHSSKWSFAITKSGQSHSSYWSFYFYLQKLHNIRTALNDHNQIKREAVERKKKKHFNARRWQRWRLRHQCAAETLLNDMLKTTFHFDLNTNEL